LTDFRLLIPWFNVLARKCLLGVVASFKNEHQSLAEGDAENRAIIRQKNEGRYGSYAFPQLSRGDARNIVTDKLREKGTYSRVTMKINEPIGDTRYAPLFIRLPLGSYFVLAGLSKLDQLAGFVTEVKKMGVLRDNLAALYATLLPYLEIFSGTLIFLGLWTTLASLISSLLLISFIIAFGFFADNTLLNKDIIVLGATLSLLYSGGGLYSLDNIRRNSG